MQIDDDQDEVIPEKVDKRKTMSHLFKAGNSEASKRKGIPNKQELTVYKVQHMQDMKQFKKFMRSYGITRIMELMEQLDADSFIKAFFMLAPYALPKMASVEARDNDDRVIHDITELQHTHTITIKDMRSGTTSTIIDE